MDHGDQPAGTGRQRWRSVRAGLCGCVVGGVLSAVLATVLFLLVRDSEPGRVLYRDMCADGPHEFERIGWKMKAEPAWSRPMRLRMAKWLVANQRLIGMTEPQLIAMLGRSEMPPLQFGERAIAYHLCVEWIDDVWLVIQLSDSGVCAEAVVRKT